MLDRDGAAARRRILYISRGVVRTALHGVEGAARELLERGRRLADRAAAAAPRRRRVDAGDAEADAAAARRRGAVAFDLALPAREAGLAQQLRRGFTHDAMAASGLYESITLLAVLGGTAAFIGELILSPTRRIRAGKLLEGLDEGGQAAIDQEFRLSGDAQLFFHSAETGLRN